MITKNESSTKKQKERRRRTFGSIYQRNSNRFEATYYFRKERFRFVTTTYAEADAQLKKIEAEIALNTYSEGSNMLFKDWLTHWLEVFVKYSVKSPTYSSYKGIIENHIIPALGEIKLNSITADHLQSFLNKKSVEGRGDGKPGGLSQKTVNNIRLVLAKALSTAEIHDKLVKNPTRAVSIASPKHPEMRVLTRLEQEIIENAVNASASPNTFGITIALYTGLRLGELLGLTLDCLHLDSPTPYIDVKRQLTRQVITPKLDEGTKIIRLGNKTRLVLGPLKTKNAYRRLYLPDFIVPMFEKIIENHNTLKVLLGSTINKHEFVFINTFGEVYDPRSFTQFFYDIVQSCDLNHANFHCLRHTYATRCSQNGVSPTVLSRLLGHAQASTALNMYTHAQDDEMLAASMAFSRNK